MMATNEGICLLTGKYTDSKYTEDCKNCGLYKDYQSNQSKEV